MLNRNSEKFLEDVEALQGKISKLNKASKTYEIKIDELNSSLDIATKQSNKFERELKSLQDKDKVIVSNNTVLKSDLDLIKEKHDKLEIENKELKTKLHEGQVMYEELKKNYESCHAALFKLNEERRKLFEDTCRSERMLKQYEKELDELRKVYELEKINYGK